MDLFIGINILVFCLSLFSMLVVVLFYPLTVSVFSRSRSLGRDEQTTTETATSVSMLVAVRNAETRIGEKIRNSLDLDYPSDRFYCKASIVVWNFMAHALIDFGSLRARSEKLHVAF